MSMKNEYMKKMFYTKVIWHFIFCMISTFLKYQIFLTYSHSHSLILQNLKILCEQKLKRIKSRIYSCIYNNVI